MQYYELLFILPGTLSEDEVKPVVKDVQEIVKANGGQNYSCDDMGKSRLAYPMKHIRYGYFQLAHFEAESKQVVVIGKKLRLVTQVLRVLIQKYDPKKPVKKISFEMALPIEQPMSVVAGEVKTRPSGEAAMATAVITKAENIEPKEENFRPVQVEKKPGSRGRKKSEKVSLDEIDKKLDEILEIDINKV